MSSPAVQGLPRLLTIMGSGETAPTMVKVHRAMLDRLGPPPVPAVLLDTPFAFQENASELSQRVQHYFAESLQADIEVATGEAFAEERLVSSVRAARYVFAGPGSPSYALRKWASTVVPSLLREKLRHGGGVTFSSAAALTLGVSTIPVYELYKVGEDPHWLTGLDVLSETGLNAAVIPHYNNAEGGTHDTRFCYLGERRLAFLETELPEGAFVLGIDEHTAITFDLGTGSAVIAGLGVVTIRVAGQSRSFAAKHDLTIADIQSLVADLQLPPSAATSAASGSATATSAGAASAGAADAADSADATASPGTGASAPLTASASSNDSASYNDSPLMGVVREQEAAFASSLGARDVAGAVTAVLELEDQITLWANDIPAGDAMDRARASLRSLVVDLAKTAETGARDPRDVVGPFVEAMLELRARARSDRRYEDADGIRERLEALGIEVRDGAEGSDWVLI